MDRQILEQSLVAQNSWWKDGKVEEEYQKAFNRKHFEEIVAELDSWKISSLIGPRRAGKTVILHQIINYLLQKKTDPKRIVYFQFGKPQLNEKGVIDNILEFISNNIGEVIDKKTDKVYVFLDEVHKLDTWSEELKDLVDLKLNIKLFISGSSSINLIKDSGEGLVGRINHHIVFPLDFREFAKVKLEIKLENQPIDRLYYNLLGRSKEIKLLFLEYLKKGGYPECVYQDNLKIVYKTLLDYKDLSFEKDIFEFTEIRDSKTLNSLIFLLSSLVSQRITYNKLGSILNTKLDTVKKYISLFEDIFLVREMTIFSRKLYFSLRQEKKITFVDTGMINSLNEKFDFDEVYLSNLVENSVSRKILENRLKVSIKTFHYYWIDEKGNEVDVIDIEEGKPIPIEIKYREDPKQISSLLKFMDRFETKKGLVITKDLFEKKQIDGKEVNFIPAWLFLLMV